MLICGVTTSRRPKFPIALVSITGVGTGAGGGGAKAWGTGRVSGCGNMAWRDMCELSGFSCGNGSRIRFSLKNKQVVLLGVT